MFEEEEVETVNDSLSDEDIAAFMAKPCTLPSDVIVTLCYFADKEDAERCGQVIRSHLEIFGRVMDLSLLEQVFVSFKYPETLASIDRGVGATQIHTPTSDEIATGVAMAPTVKRGDVWKSVIVLNASYGRSLSYEPEDPSTETRHQLAALRALTIHTLAHECGHVHDHAMQMKHMGSDSFLKKWTPIENYLMEPAMACWSEFMAEYMSAQYGNAETLQGYEDSFIDRLKLAWPAITKAIRHYRMHGDTTRVLSEVAVHVRLFAVHAGYLLGFLAKEERSLADATPKVLRATKDHPEIGQFLEPLQRELLKLLEIYPEFSGLGVFQPLSGVLANLYERVGMKLRENTDGNLFVDIPHRSDTMATLSEQFAFRMGQM